MMSFDFFYVTYVYRLRIELPDKTHAEMVVLQRVPLWVLSRGNGATGQQPSF